MIDADHFKKINDKYGHMEEDRALQVIAEALRTVFGKNGNFLSRYGGDEFVVIVENQVDLNMNRLIALCREEIDKEASMRKLPYRIKISAGYSQFENSETTPVTKLIQLADKKMYEQKKSGDVV